MADQPVMFHDQLQAGDKRSHIERIDPLPNGESPAWLPRASQWHAEALRPELEPEKEMPEGERKPYMLMAPAYHADVRIPAGEVVWLYDSEVGSHHVLVEFDPRQIGWVKIPDDDAHEIPHDEVGEAEEGTPSDAGEAAAPKKSRRAKE